MDIYDVAIIGGGPGGLACAIKAQELGLSYVILEKGQRVLQGISNVQKCWQLEG